MTTDDSPNVRAARCVGRRRRVVALGEEAVGFPDAGRRELSPHRRGNRLLAEMTDGRTIARRPVDPGRRFTMPSNRNGLLRRSDTSDWRRRTRPIVSSRRAAVSGARLIGTAIKDGRSAAATWTDRLADRAW